MCARVGVGFRWKNKAGRSVPMRAGPLRHSDTRIRLGKAGPHAPSLGRSGSPAAASGDTHPQGWGGLASGIPRNPAARVNFRTASPPGGSHPAPREVGGDQRGPSLPPPPRPAPPRPKGPASPPPSPSPSQSPAGSSGPALPSGQRAAPELEGLRAGTPGLGGGRGWSGPGAGFEDGLSPAFAVAQAAALLRPPSSFPPPPEGIR